ncbi:MAG: S-methyl-5'-thioadenosine phosphorylase [Gemmatimonadetes bacterium]|jgi:5'-methylthioadenosine phosphorylase|nr:S-methyl-5'-thioadenosine phosphorylase [Gemmatimonadota bacterium]MBT6146093.1 S-methyl-5'-thioadenosine phosphorylase [Gemmatimonadota bacterium]MBT7863520.1 S-methyl-5'-thioadenosine phosphorylase [Gemmatimonadota bacterium]
MSQLSPTPVRLGVIGGSGVYQMQDVEVVAEHDLTTPFGRPSDPVVETKIGDRSVFFLPRHGKGHRYTPSEVPYRANVHVLKQLGVTHLLSVSAVGIMQPHIRPGDMVIPDQIFDRTKDTRPSTFFGDGIVGHVSLADPFCDDLRQVVAAAARACGATVHEGGTYVCMEGPQFSTRAESNFYRSSVDATVIGMTAIPEAKLAREAEMCYATLAMGTDYDCWHEEEEDVSVEAVIAILKANAELGNRVVQDVGVRLPAAADCACHAAARFAIITSPDAISDEAKQRLCVLYGHYFGE